MEGGMEIKSFLSERKSHSHQKHTFTRSTTFLFLPIFTAISLSPKPDIRRSKKKKHPLRNANQAEREGILAQLILKTFWPLMMNRRMLGWTIAFEVPIPDPCLSLAPPRLQGALISDPWIVNAKQFTFKLRFRKPLPAKSFGISAFLLPDFHQFISSRGRSLGLQEFRAWPRESYWTWPQWHQSFRKWRQLQAAQPVSWPGRRQSCSQGAKHPSMTRSHHASFRKGSHVPRVSATAYWQTSPSIILLYVFKIILCNAPRMSELLYELTSLHISQLISGNSNRQGPRPCLSTDLFG